MQFIIPIAIKPHLKKYLAKHASVEPFEIGSANHFALFLLNTLKHPRPIFPYKDYHIDISVHSEAMNTTVCETYWKERGYFISEIDQYYFNKFCEQIFRDEMYKYIWMRIGKKGSLNQAINTFCEHYSITEDDLSLKTIQKWCERRRRRVTASKSA